MKLTILIPSIPERLHKARKLYKKLGEQKQKALEAGDIENLNEVQILCFCDDMIRSIGEKRNNLLKLVQAERFAFVDDDDDVSDNYIEEILEAIIYDPDIITFEQIATLNGKSFKVTFGLDIPKNEKAKMIEGEWIDIKRRPWHVCVWKTKLVQRINFPFIQYGEDWAWCKKALRKIKTSAHIDKVLHYYNWDSKKTRAK